MPMTAQELEVLALEAAGGPGGGLTVHELHGAVIGIGVTDSSHFELQDLVDLLGADALSDGATVARFVNDALEALHSEDMSFVPLLPEDDALMEERLSALAEWCQSFLTGFAAGLSRRGVESLKGLPDEAQEIVQDFAAIAQLETELYEDEADEGEAHFVELEEYVKVGALLIMSLLSDAGDDTQE
jgi:uncharacterized protein YgfB (UPF0149 family)